jgi:serine O-acetyltransferase
MIRSLLFADLERQFRLENQPDCRPTLGRLVARVLHPRFLPIVLFRCAHSAWASGLRPFAHLFTYANRVWFGIEIPARCEIGPGIFFPHTHGTVIGALSIGANATIFQGVTLGARDVDMTFTPELRPRVGNNVTIGAGAKVLGGLVLGDNVRIGANAVVLRSVPDNCTAVGIPARILAGPLSERETSQTFDG